MTHPDRKLNPWLTDVGFTIKENEHGYETTTEYESAGLDGGGGYSLAPAAANDMLGQARSALADLQNLQRRTETLRKLEPPAKDPASVAYNARLVNGSGAFDQGVDHITVEIACLNELIGKIEEAFEKITGHDATAAIDVTKAGNPPTESPRPSQEGAAG